MENFLLWLLYAISFSIVIAVQIAYSRLKLSHKIKNIQEFSQRITRGDAQEYGQRFRDNLLKLVWTGTWPVVFATVLLIIFLIVYLYTKNIIFGHLLEVNFGLVIGTMVQMVFKK